MKLSVWADPRIPRTGVTVLRAKHASIARGRCALALIALLCAGSGFRAPPAQAQIAATPAASGGEFKREIEAAVGAFNEGRFADARTHFAAAHGLKPSARTLRGLGACALELGAYEQAERELRAALDEPRGALDPSLRSETEQLLARARTGREAALTHEPESANPIAAESGPQAAPVATEAVQPAPHPRDTPRKRWSTLRSLAVAGLSLGTAGLVAGGVLGLRSMHFREQVQERCGPGPSCPTRRGVEAADAAIAYGHASTAAWALGGALVAAGITLYVLERRTGAHDARTALRVGPGTLALGGRW